VNNRKELKVPVEEYMFSSNERLEFLGDSIFNSVITCIIYKKYHDKDEGFLTRIRTKIVRSSHCVIFAKKLGLDKHILTSNKILGIGTVGDKRMINDRVLEDAFEAFIGAIYLDLGYKYAELFIKRLVDTMVNFNEILKDDNYKDILMRYTQAYGYELPVYVEVSSGGMDDSSPKFTMSVQLVPLAEDKQDRQVIKDICYGSGNSKKEAEQNAAKHLCSLLDSNLKHIINRDGPDFK
jgi:dsRNA-specific ribonuclease